MKLICIRKSRTFPFYFGRVNLFYEYESVEELKKEEEIYKMRKMSDKEREGGERWTFFLNVLFNAIFVLEKFQIRFSRNSHSVFFFSFLKMKIQIFSVTRIIHIFLLYPITKKLSSLSGWNFS